MNDQEKRRRSLFEKFSLNNLLTVQAASESPLDNFRYSKDTILCPLCMNEFSILALNQREENPLTIEHCPPAELGGKPMLLLCKACNSNTGTLVDAKLINYLDVKPFNNKEDESEVTLKNTKLVSDNLDVRGTAVLKRESKNSFYFDLKIADQYRKQRLASILNGNEFQIEYKPHTTPSTHIIQIGLLKIAYLLAFTKFGYSLIKNENYSNIRRQILDPAVAILPSKGVSQNVMLPTGFYLVRQPIFLQGILVVFNLVRNDRIDKFSVILNHPKYKDIEFYSNLRFYDLMTFTLEKEDFIDLDFLANKRDIKLFQEALNKPYFINLNRLGLDFYYRDPF